MLAAPAPKRGTESEQSAALRVAPMCQSWRPLSKAPALNRQGRYGKTLVRCLRDGLSGGRQLPAPAGSPGRRVDIVVKLDGLSVAHLPHMRERCPHFSSSFRRSPELPDHDHVVAEGLEEPTRLSAELIEFAGTAANTSFPTLCDPRNVPEGDAAAAPVVRCGRALR